VRRQGRARGNRSGSRKAMPAAKSVRCRYTGDAVNRQRGMALLMTLWIITLLTIIAASFVLEIRRESVLARNLVEIAQARQLAEAGVHYAMLQLLNADPERPWPTDGSVRQITLDGVAVRIAVLDESGRIDLNHASATLLDGLLRSAGVEPDWRPALIDAILDWRDPNPGQRPQAPSASDYARAGLAYGPRNGPFQSVEELQLVLGISPALYRKLAPWLTLATQQDGVNPAVAPRPVLLALPGASVELVDAYLEQRRLHREQGLPPPAFEGVGGNLAGGSGVAYSIRALARLPGGTVGGIGAVIAPNPADPNRPFRVLAWRELGSGSVAFE